MSHLTDAIDRLDRLHQFFADRPSEDVFAELFRFVEVLRRDSELGSIFDELLAECLARLSEIQIADEAAAKELAEIRQELVGDFPELADREDERPDQDHPLQGIYSLAQFDTYGSQSSPIRFSVVSRDTDDDSLTRKLIGILRPRVQRLGDARLYPPDEKSESIGASYLRRIRNVEARFDHLRKEWLLFDRTSGSAAALRILGMVSYLNPKPSEMGADFNLLAFANAAMAEMFHPLTDLRHNTFGEPVERANTPRDAAVLEMMRTEARRLYEEMRRRLLYGRSYRALVLRFAQWVQLYQRDELYKLALKSPRKVEDVLTQQLARFLFEAGLDPLTKANVGTTQPDVLDPTARWTFYVEAKQYGKKSPRSVIVPAFRQVADTLLRLRGLPNGVREAFLVVFRVAGPLAEMPQQVAFDGVRIWPILVDLAPPTETGSSQKHHPVTISADDLRSRPTAKGKKKKSSKAKQSK